jgi:hypothetical protein
MTVNRKKVAGVLDLYHIDISVDRSKPPQCYTPVIITLFYIKECTHIPFFLGNVFSNGENYLN